MFEHKTQAQEIVLAGAGGCMRELIWQIQEANRQQEHFHIVGYVDREKPQGETGVVVGGELIRYLGDDDVLLQRESDTDVVISVGAPALRQKIAEKLKHNPRLHFPSLILGNTALCEDVVMGEGCIVSMDARISTNVRLGNFVFLNTGSKICHDGRVGDFVTLGPNAVLAGAVTVGEGSEICLGAKVIQGIRIGAHTVAGAGSVVIRDVESDCTVVGVPAKQIRKREIQG
jgi:sugar O-acyltransferase (sialic acid O-acetyltransferase NeuD family)